ncbi:MBL fold metallo-hydrolase [Candidatus Saccharibacteria bacterium]|nr:MBL fold metallo-hydrolase [Candidatus Saccharibacteria bacterium]
MELEFFGGNCFRIKTKNTTIVVDDNLSKLGKKSINSDKTVAFYTSKTVLDEKSAAQSRLSFATPGEFEVGDVTVNGVQARGHMDEEGNQTSNVFQFMHGGQTISVLGHVHPDISDEVVELISGTDVLVVPVGGNGFTLDPVGAASIIKKTEPNVVVPAHYDISGVSYEVPAQPLEEFLKVASLTADEPQESLKLSKASEDVGTQTKVVVLKVK